jgi:ferredoxin-NADP reductase
MAHRWTTSWRARPTTEQPVLPADRPAAPAGYRDAGPGAGTGTMPRREAGSGPRRDTGAWPPAQGLPTPGLPVQGVSAPALPVAPAPSTKQLPPWETDPGQTAVDPRLARSARGGDFRGSDIRGSDIRDGDVRGGIRVTGSMPAAGGPRASAPAEPAQGTRTGATGAVDTGARRAAGVSRTTGSMRAVRPIAPGTGQARVVLPWVILAVIGLGLIGVAYLWWRATIFIHSPGAVVVDIGEILGLLSGYGFVILVALMARLPPLERGVGTDRLARWHATGGRWTISLVTGHVIFIIIGYTITAHSNVFSETAFLVTTLPDVLAATVAWGILLGVAAFSMRAARRKMRYETWYYAHLYTYLAIALAFSHQFADGGAFAESLGARIAWSCLYVVVGGLLLWYRVVTPLWNSYRYQFTVQSVRPEAHGIVSVFIGGRDFDRLRAEPGQFFRWRFLTKELWWQSNPYSLSAMPQPNLMRITVKARGDHSGSLANLRPGSRIIAEGPYGAFVPSLTGRRVLLIAGGVGITPIRAMFAALPKRMSGGITLVYRASHPRDVVFSRELNAIASDRQAALHYLIGSRGELGFDPLDADHLAQTVPGLHRYEAYVCGPSGMTQAAVKSLEAAGVPRRRIHSENFDF